MPKQIKTRAYYEKLAAVKRIKEPSTMAGAAALLMGANEMFQVVDPATAEAAGLVIDTLAPVILNPTPMGIGMALFGLFSIFMKEKGGK